MYYMITEKMPCYLEPHIKVGIKEYILQMLCRSLHLSGRDMYIVLRWSWIIWHTQVFMPSWFHAFTVRTVESEPSMKLVVQCNLWIVKNSVSRKFFTIEGFLLFRVVPNNEIVFLLAANLLLLRVFYYSVVYYSQVTLHCI